jgi:hypothetical protein
MITELFWKCGIFRHNFETVLTVWYISAWFRHCSESVVFSDMISELFWQCGIFLHDFGTVLTVWYFPIWFLNCSDSVVFSTWFRNCSDSVVFFYIISEHFWQFGIFLHNFGTALTLWYFSTSFLNCSDSVVFFFMYLYKARKVNCHVLVC